MTCHGLWMLCNGPENLTESKYESVTNIWPRYTYQDAYTSETAFIVFCDEHMETSRRPQGRVWRLRPVVGVVGGGRTVQPARSIPEDLSEIFQPTNLHQTFQQTFSVNNHLVVKRVCCVRPLQSQVVQCATTSNNSRAIVCCNKCCQETELDHNGGTRWSQGGRAWLVQSRRTCTKNASLAWTTILLPLLQRPSTRYIIVVNIQHLSAKY